MCVSRLSCWTDLSVALTLWRNQLEEGSRYLDRAESRVSEVAGVDPLLVEEVDRTLAGSLLRSTHTRRVSGSVAAVHSLEVNVVVGPDEVSVADLSSVGERIHQREISTALFNEHHVPELAPMLQYRRVGRGVLHYLIDDLSRIEIAAHVVSCVGLGNTYKRQEYKRYRERAQHRQSGNPAQPRDQGLHAFQCEAE